MTRLNMQTPQPPLGGVAPVDTVPTASAVGSATVPEGFPEGKQNNKITKEHNNVAAATPFFPVPCRSMAWFLNDNRRPEQARVDRIEITHIAKPNVYGDECPWNERIVYYVGRCQRLSTEVFATKEELINSLMQ